MLIIEYTKAGDKAFEKWNAYILVVGIQINKVGKDIPWNLNIK